MSLQTRRAAVLTVLALALTGCAGGGDGAGERPGASAPSSPSSSASSDGSAQTTPSDEQTPTTAAQVESSASPAPDPAQEATQPAAEAGAGTDGNDPSGLSAQATAFFASGGACYSDFFPSGTPSPEVLTEIRDYCATTDASAWDLQDGVPNPFGIPDPRPEGSEGTGDGTADGDGYQRPAPDADGHVGPSEEYYTYDGHVEPGFEYQVGSECFDANLGRCKTSGELQTEYLEGREVEEILREQGREVPGSSEATGDDWEELGFGCFEDEAGNAYCVDPPPGY